MNLGVPCLHVVSCHFRPVGPLPNHHHHHHHIDNEIKVILYGSFAQYLIPAFILAK